MKAGCVWLVERLCSYPRVGRVLCHQRGEARRRVVQRVPEAVVGRGGRLGLWGGSGLSAKERRGRQDLFV